MPVDLGLNTEYEPKVADPLASATFINLWKMNSQIIKRGRLCSCATAQAACALKYSCSKNAGKTSSTTNLFVIVIEHNLLSEIYDNITIDNIS